MYIGIRWGWPQPIITISVGVERVAKVDGGIDSERTRMYSWQFYSRMKCVSEDVFR